jgi:outer membrane protein assembly factor BamB
VPTDGDARSAIGPDGVAYVVEDTGDSEGWRGRLTAYDLGGVRPGWPVTFPGMGSAPAFGPDGRLFVIAATSSRSRVLAFASTGDAIAVTSPRLTLAAADPGVDCAGGPPTAPTVTRDGTVFAWKFTEAPVFALDPSLKVRDGWPYVQPAGRPPNACAGADGICCEWYLDTARTVGPDATLYLALQRRKATVGGRITAIGSDGKVLAGWPVELRRPGSMFTAIELGTDGVVYALATEPEGRGRMSATILAIEPDGEVRYHTTVADP